MAKLSERTGRISGSSTQAVTTIVDRLRRSGVPVIDFGAGEPDFPTVEVAKIAAHQAIDANFTKYTPNAGAADLKRAICDRYRADYGVEYRESEVIVNAGGKQALYNTALALFGPGDDVVTHAPYWPTIPEQIRLADARDALLAATAIEHGLTLVTRQTAAYKGARVKLFNPWGYTPEDEEDADWRQAGRAGPLWLKNLFVRA